MDGYVEDWREGSDKGIDVGSLQSDGNTTGPTEQKTDDILIMSGDGYVQDWAGIGGWGKDGRMDRCKDIRREEECRPVWLNG